MDAFIQGPLDLEEASGVTKGWIKGQKTRDNIGEVQIINLLTGDWMNGFEWGYVGKVLFRVGSLTVETTNGNEAKLKGKKFYLCTFPA